MPLTQAAIDNAGVDLAFIGHIANDAEDAVNPGHSDGSANNRNGVPVKNIRRVMSELILAGGFQHFDTKAEMEASDEFAYPALAIVLTDPTPANNTVYRWVVDDEEWVEAPEYYTAIANVVQPLVDAAQAAAADATDTANDLTEVFTAYADEDTKFFGLRGDSKLSKTPTGFVNGGNTVTIAGANFTNDDIGKLIYCSRQGVGYTSPILPVGTITAVNSAINVTTSTTWTESHSGGVVYQIVWGTDDTAAMIAMGALARTTGSFRLPAGRYILRACPIDWNGLDKPLSIRGAGADITAIHIAPDYDWSTTGSGAQNCLLFRSNTTSEQRAFMSGFSMFGPLFTFSGRTAYNGLVNVWPESTWLNVKVMSLNGLAAGGRMSSAGTLIDFYSKEHFAGGTHGLIAANYTTGYWVHTGNCNGIGTYVLNLAYDTPNTQQPINFMNSLFDECEGDAVRVEGSQNIKFIGCSMFGGPNSAGWALRLTSNSTVALDGTHATGYGNFTPRKGVSIAAGCTLKVFNDSKITNAGDGTGAALDNAGTFYMDQSSRLIGIVTGSGTRLTYGMVSGQNAVGVPLTGSTALTTLANPSLPANSMGPNGRTVLEAQFSFIGVAGTKHVKISFGGVDFFDDTLSGEGTLTIRKVIANRGATNSQIGGALASPGEGYTSTAGVTSAVDTTAAVSLVFAAQCGNVADTIRLERYSFDAVKGT